MEKITDAQVYVGSYRKYNEGSLFGEWIKLSDFTDRDDFYEHIRKLHKDEADPEFMFQDWENIPDGLIGECSISDSVFELIDVLDDADDTEQEAFFAWASYFGHDLKNRYASQLLTEFRDAYCGQYDSEEEYAEELVEQCYELPDFALTYFDYERFSRDLFCCDYTFHDGFVFRCC